MKIMRQDYKLISFGNFNLLGKIPASQRIKRSSEFL
jgi:hypothetical protein